MSVTTLAQGNELHAVARDAHATESVRDAGWPIRPWRQRQELQSQLARGRYAPAARSRKGGLAHPE